MTKVTSYEHQLSAQLLLLNLLPKPHVPNTKRYIVQLVDDHQMMRVGLIALAGTTGKRLIQWMESSNLSDALEHHAEQTRVDLVLLDLNLPDSQGLTGLRHFLRRFPTARVAVFSATEDEFVIRQAMALGAIGFVCKSASAQATLVLVESLLMGDKANSDTEPMALELSSSPSLSPWTLQTSAATSIRHISLAQMRNNTSALSPTQIQVLELVLEGMTNQEIASASKLALGTVKNTVSAVMLTLDVHSRSHLISLFR